MFVDTAIVEPLLTLLNYDKLSYQTWKCDKIKHSKASSNLPTHPQLDFDVLLLVRWNLYKWRGTKQSKVPWEHMILVASCSLVGQV